MKSTTKKKCKWLHILLASIGGMLIIGTAFVMISLYVAAPTKGNIIARYENPKSALLVIDVQNDTTTNTGFYGDTAGFVEKVNQAITFAEESGMEILYVKNVTGKNPIVLVLSRGRYRSGSEGVELDSYLQVVNGNVFTKSVGDSFSSKEFEDYLVSKHVNTLYIVGADATACVYSTAKGGLNRNYNVSIIKDAIITINDKAMKQMLEQYEKDGIGVIDLERFQELGQP